MSSEIGILLATAASIGFIHTLIGPDHYLPFIVMSKARGWSLAKTIWITVACGIGHVLSSILIGFIGIALGVAVGKLEAVEGLRGDLAAWALIAFGLVYAVWGLKRALSQRPHTHTHLTGNLAGMTHTHDPSDSHDHQSESRAKAAITPWVLFTVFVLGPCEPLIPILMYPAAQHDKAGVALVVTVFGLITVATMTTIVVLASYGMKFVSLGKLERFSHAIAGSTIALSGIAIQILGV